MEKRHRKSVEMHMSHEMKSDLIPKLRIRYARRNREGKSRMLDEVCEDHGYERKYAIKLLSDTLPKATDASTLDLRSNMLPLSRSSIRFG
jgi:hypothetical protein